MGLSCSCDDWDKGDADRWWEPGRRAIPPAGSRCCECSAPLPAEPLTCIVHMEVYEPDETDGAPRSFEADHSVSCSTLARHDEQALESYEDAMDDFRDAHGWDDEYERFERVTGRDHRCERCEGLVSLFEDDLGYCLISPGELPEAHLEYIEEQGGDEMLWKRGRDGILNPVRMTRLDFAKCEARRRWRNFKYLTWHGGWKHRARYVWFPRVKRKLDGVSRA